MEKNVKVHCLTNPVTMQSVANVLLAAGGSAVMAQDEQEVEEITAICQATLLNTGVPDERKIRSCILAGKCANRLGHPVVLDPVGAGASKFRRKKIGQLLQSVVPSIIRCNQEEASALLRAEDEKEFLVLGTERQKIEGTAESCQQDGDAVFSGIQSGGVESSLELELEKARRLAVRLAKKYRCTVCMTGEQDVISDGERVKVISGGDGRICRITGSGCMLSALCALKCGDGTDSFEAAVEAAETWRHCAERAGETVDEKEEGIGSFQIRLLDALSLKMEMERGRRMEVQSRMKQNKKRYISPEQLRLYAVTDRKWLAEGETLETVVETLVRSGVTCVQLREKHASDEEIISEGKKLNEICRKHHVPLIVNDRPDLAKKIGAAGVHVGLSDMGIEKARELLGEDFIIGGSAHNVKEALQAQKAGADYIGCGAVFGSQTKSDVTTLAKEELCAIWEAVEIPVVAIGGITAENIKELTGTGIDGVAVVSGLFAAKDKPEMVRRFLKAFEMKKVLTIAGSDCSGGAGIQADLKTMAANGVYGMSAVMALTAQNTTGVQGIMEVTPEFAGQQIDSIFTDIRPDAVKIGMLSSGEIIHVVAEKLKEYQAEHIVLDPVMVSTSGHRLIQKDAEQSLKKELFPLAELITPNIPEAEVLSGRKIKNAQDMESAAEKIVEEYGCAVLLKGGHRINDANDFLCTGEKKVWICGERVENPNTHGTGCTLSSAIASNLAKGAGMEEAVQKAKEYLTEALKEQLDLGAGSGPMDHTLGKIIFE